MKRLALAFGLMVSVLSGCALSTEQSSVTLELRTDYRPGVEMDSVFVELDDGRYRMLRSSDPEWAGLDFEAGARVWDLATPFGEPIGVHVELRLGDAVMARRYVVLPIDGRTGATIVLSRPSP